MRRAADWFIVGALRRLAPGTGANNERNARTIFFAPHRESGAYALRNSSLSAQCEILLSRASGPQTQKSLIYFRFWLANYRPVKNLRAPRG